MAKTYAGTYLYSKYHEYEEKIYTFVIVNRIFDRYSISGGD